MSLKLMYITNDSSIATIAEDAGVDRIFIDMEYIGKNERQLGLDTVKSRHVISDVSKIRKCISKPDLLVRVNPIHDSSSMYCDSEDEIKSVIDAGADIIMLPMYRSEKEVEEFLRYVDGKVKTILLVETPEACKIMDNILGISEIDEFHLGLNDLHIAFKKKFMFELLADGTVDFICNKIKKSNKPFGFGGIARIGYGTLPAEYIIAEHYRIGSTRAILSRSFCNANRINNLDVIEEVFHVEVARIRDAEEKISKFSEFEYKENKELVRKLVDNIVLEQKE